MDDVGPEGQKALLDAEVLVLGAGGLVRRSSSTSRPPASAPSGSPTTTRVELSNLQRQVIHGNDDVGRKKVDSAADFVAQLNPDIDVRKHEMRVTADNIEELISGYDFVVDGTDNFATRYLVNDACTLAGVPFSHGSIFKFEGQVTTFAGGEDSPCYRCLFPERRRGMVPNCSTAGVLGVLPGTVGCLQATETVKHIIGEGETLDGSMLFFDALDMEFDKVEIPKRDDCPVCGDDPAIESVHDVSTPPPAPSTSATTTNPSRRSKRATERSRPDIGSATSAQPPPRR